MINKYFKNAGIDNPKITPHSLRHTAAYINLSNGGTLEATRQLLRHKHIESTLTNILLKGLSVLCMNHCNL
jgi:integrase/recombinase XerC